MDIQQKVKLALKNPIITLYGIFRRIYIFLTWPISTILKDILYSHHYIFWWGFNNHKKVKIAWTAIINNAFLNVNSGNITIEDYVFFGHDVSLITWTHDYTLYNHDRIATIPGSWRDITIKQGARIWANSIILWPCVVGEHSVIAAGSVVTKNVLAYSIVWWIPAKLIKNIISNESNSAD